MGYSSLFWFPGVISTINEPQGAFTCQSSKLAVLANSGLFHGLLITVLGPRSDCHHSRPHGAFTCRSSTLAVLADSGVFHGLLITVLGPRSDFHHSRTPGCIYVPVINTRSFCRFLPVSWAINHRFGSPE